MTDRAAWDSTTVPRATCRIQFGPAFPFAAAARQASRLARLGISHVYASPILTARAGSVHGYDVVRHDEVNPELGGMDGFLAMAESLRAEGVGLILDIVPNHMAVGHADNPVWLDLLKRGRASRHAPWFDIDFDRSDPALVDKVHVPMLDAPLADALDRQALDLRALDGGGYGLVHGDHLFPIRAEDDAMIAADGLESFRMPERMAALIARQHYVLDWWRNAGDRINWRRFFDITHLAALRMDCEDAFAAVHAIPLALYAAGHVDGVRVDHIDGLADPRAYCRRLRAELDARRSRRPAWAASGRAWVLVEKILAPGERLAADWDADGTTGYDFMDEVAALLHDERAGAALGEHWAGASGRSPCFGPEEEEARRDILSVSFAGQHERLVDVAIEAHGESAARSGLTRSAMRRALADALVAMRAYRGYEAASGDGLAPGGQVEAALRRAMARPLADRQALEVLADLLLSRHGDRKACADLRRRFNQLAAPLAAKAVEDTAFYRYGRLLSRNDVGFDAGRIGMPVADFHDLMEMRALEMPRSMLATATHDHKRGEDVRARLATLSDIPRDWIAATRRWNRLTRAIRPEGLGDGDVHMLYQTVVGAWPPDLAPNDTAGLAALAARVAEWWCKALREAKLRSGWLRPDEETEARARDFVTQILDPQRGASFLADIATFLDMVMRPGAANGLVQVSLRCLCPGVPDLFQGGEFWDHSLVDPDNRRPVDHEARAHALDEVLARSPSDGDFVASWTDGHVKLALLHRLLHLRAAMPALFAVGDYRPLVIHGPRRRHVIAFLRRHEDHAVLVVAGLGMTTGIASAGGLVPQPAWWRSTLLRLPADLPPLHGVIGPDCEILGREPRPLGSTLALSDAVPVLPLGVWATSPA